MAARFKRLEFDSVDLGGPSVGGDESETESGVSTGEEGQVELIMSERPSSTVTTLKRKWHTFKGRRSFRASWKAMLIAVLVFVVAIIISLLLAKLLTGSSPAPSSNAAVATDAPVCSDMAASILEKNGSAVDAAITALLCVGAVQPESSGIGGGGYMVVRADNGSVYTIDFRATAPAKSSRDMFESDPTRATLGGLSVGVPGEVRGMEVAHKMFGRLPWRAVFEPVIQLCRDGFSLTTHSARAINSTSKYFVQNEIFRKMYYNENGELKTVGDTVTRPEYADTLERIANFGAKEFYTMETAESIVDEVQNDRGILSLEDLAGYEVVLRDPIHVDLQNHTVYSMGAPAGGGVLLLSLAVLDLYNFSPSDSESGLTYHRLVETFKYAFALRTQLGDSDCALCDGESVAAVEANMTSKAFAKYTQQSIIDNETFSDPAHYHAHYSTPSDHGTTHISVLGPDGQAVSVTSSVNTYFGSKLMTSTGIVLNNDMDDFSSPNITNSFGVEPSEANFILPGKRPQSSMCPAIFVTREVNSQPWLIIGAAGGTIIPTSVIQSSLGVLSFDRSLADAIEARRLHHQLSPNIVAAEFGYPDKILDYLRGLGHNVNVSSAFAVVQGVLRDSNGTVSGHSDSRKQSRASVLHVNV